MPYKYDRTGPVPFFILGGAGRAPQPDKSGFPTAYGLRPFCGTVALNLCRIVRVWIGPLCAMVEGFYIHARTTVGGRLARGSEH